MDVAIGAYLTLLQILDMNMTLKNRSRKVTRLCFLLSFFPPKSWLVVTQNQMFNMFPAVQVYISPLRRAHICKSRAMNYFPCLILFSFRSNQNLLLFTLNLKLLFTSVFIVVQIISDASFLGKDPNTSSNIQYNFQNLFDLEETQPCIQNTFQVLNV